MRERGDDIILLARHFLRHFNSDESRRFVLTAEAEDALRSHEWPGTCASWRTPSSRAIAFTPGREIGAADLDGLSRPGSRPTPGWPVVLNDRPFRDAKRAVVEASSVSTLSQVLRSSGGNITRAARTAHKERRDFGRLIRKYELDPQHFS